MIIISYLYITEHGAVMGLDGGYFVVHYKDGLVRHIPKETLESVALFGNVTITSACTAELLKRDIPVSYFSPKGAYFGRLHSTRNDNVFRLKKQIFLSEDAVFPLELSKRLVTAKINNQIILLKRYSRHSEKKPEQQIKMMQIMLAKVMNVLSPEELMGYEGTAARSYFDGLSELIQPEFAFKGRNRMPPKDPFNSMLSLGYTLLMYEIYGELENKGFTPYCGFMHKDREHHPTLASDMMEEWRAVIVDSVVLSMIQGREISTEHFTADENSGGVFLTQEGMKIFLKKYEAKLRSEHNYLGGQQMSYRHSLWFQVSSLTKAVTESDPCLYTPITLR